MRKRGYNKLRYGKLATQIGVTKSTLRKHFPKKKDLGIELIRRFTTNVLEALNSIDWNSPDNASKLREYARVYEGSLQENQMCLCGMMAAEHETLSEEMQQAINAFFDCHEIWIIKVLFAGKDTGELQFTGPAREHAQFIVSSLQGALLVAKSTGSTKRMTASASNLVDSYTSKATAG